MSSPAEQAIQAFHARHPGATRSVFGVGRTPEGRTSYERLAEILRRRVGRGGVVLDLAGGDGPLAERLLEADRRVVLCDLSEAELAMARAGCGAATVRSPAQRLPLADASFAGVGCHMALMLLDDVGDVIDEVARVLRPGGVFAATVGRSTPRTDPMALVFAHLRDVLEASRQPALAPPSAPVVMDRDGLSTLFATRPWHDVATTDVDLTVHVPRHDVAAWLATAYYPIAQLTPPERRAFDGWVERHIDELAPSADVMTWTFALREIVAQRR